MPTPHKIRFMSKYRPDRPDLHLPACRPHHPRVRSQGAVAAGRGGGEDEVAEPREGLGFGQVVALGVGDAELRQRGQLLGALHPFSGDVQPQTVPQVGEQLHDGVVARVVQHPGHERPVDLQAVHRQGGQVAQVRRPGPHVVEGEPHPRLDEPFQARPGLGQGLQVGVLGQFQAQPLRRQAGLAQHLRDHGVEWGGQGRRGQVDVDPVGRGVAERPVQLEHVRAGAVQHPAVQQWQVAAAPGPGQEAAGGEQSHARVLPADQRLHRHHPAVGDTHDRLVVQAQFAVLDGLGDGAVDQLDVAGQARLHPDGELHLIAAGLLGPVHRHVGLTDQRLWVGQVPGDGHADTGVRVQCRIVPPVAGRDRQQAASPQLQGAALHRRVPR